MARRKSITPSQAFGIALKRFRAKKGVTQEDLAHESEISLTSLARIETGAHGTRLDTILKLANGLGVSASVLVRECEDILGGVSDKAANY